MSSRLAPYATAFATVIILSFSAQILLFNPMSGMVLELTFQFAFTYLAGGFLFFASLSALALVFTDPGKSRQAIYTGIAILALITISIHFIAQGMNVEAILTGGLASGLFFNNWPPKWLSASAFKDWLPVFVQGINTIVGLGMLAAPKAILASPVYAPIQGLRIIIAIVFLITSALAAFFALRPTFRDAWYARILALPLLTWIIIFAAHAGPISMLVPAGALAATLLFLDFIPWAQLVLPPKDNLGRRVMGIMLAANIFIILLFSVLLQTHYSTPSSPEQTRLDFTLIILSYNIVFGGSLILMGTINLAINGLFQFGKKIEDSATGLNLAQLYPQAWTEATNHLIEPLKETQHTLEAENSQQKHNIATLNNELQKGKRRLTQLNLINELDQQLRTILDTPVAAQLTVNAIQRAFTPSLVVVFIYESARHELVSISTAGELAGTIPPGYRQHIQKGLIGRAARLHKTQYAPDTRIDSDHIALDNQTFLSELAIPLIHQGQLKGMIVVAEIKQNAFSLMDIETLESVANQLISSWNRSDYDQRLRELIRAGILLSSTLETETAVREVASAAQQTLGARFVFITLLNQDHTLSRVAYAGYAPKLINYLSDSTEGNAFIQSIINATQIIRSRDIRKLDGSIIIDNNGLRGFMGFPIRLRGNRIGAILSFGKQGGMYFTEEDESLATLISNQAAAAVETTWLYQELRSALNTATLLHQLSIKIIQSEHLTEAAAAVAETAKKLSNASAAGIVLLTPRKEIQAQVQIDAAGMHSGTQHPMSLIRQAMQNKQSIIVSAEKLATVCMPLQTHHGEYGAMWLNIPESYWYNSRYSANLLTLANQAAIALERIILLVETRRQREKILEAYQELETTYDQTLIALTSALDARDRETEGHCARVAELTSKMGERLGLSADELKSLRRGALLHDIGKIGISDTILLKPDKLTEEEWDAMRQHPDIGARIIEGIPFLQDALPVIRYHQERWDGSGYPIGLKGEKIPFQARIFAVADVFDALTSKRPYREPISAGEAIVYLREQSEKHFDQLVVEALASIEEDGFINEYVAS